MPKKLLKIISLLLCLTLLFEQSGFAQVAGELDISGYLSSLHSSIIQEKFRPLHLRYLSYDNLNNNFKLLLDKGDFKNPQTRELEDTIKTLLSYFFVGISLPNESFWVNLRPDSPDNIIDDYLAQTDVGKVLLEADLQLKKDTASMTSPQTLEGKQYWERLYKKAEELLGYDNITIPTLVRPWIVPGEIIIRETENNAYIYKANLKVMLEQDYLKDSSTYNFIDPRLKILNEYSSQLIKELIIPKLTKEVNTSKKYAPLRQVYYSLILAQWFKARFYGKGGLYSYLIDKKDLSNLTSKDNWSKQTYFQAYQASFKDGEYNLKEPVSTPFGQSIRSYFSGGVDFNLNFGKGASSPLKAGTQQVIGPALFVGGKSEYGSSTIINRKEIIRAEVNAGSNPGELGRIEIVETPEASSPTQSLPPSSVEQPDRDAVSPVVTQDISVPPMEEGGKELEAITKKPLHKITTTEIGRLKKFAMAEDYWQAAQAANLLCELVVVKYNVRAIGAIKELDLSSWATQLIKVGLAVYAKKNHTAAILILKNLAQRGDQWSQAILKDVVPSAKLIKAAEEGDFDAHSVLHALAMVGNPQAVAYFWVKHLEKLKPEEKVEFLLNILTSEMPTPEIPVTEIEPNNPTVPDYDLSEEENILPTTVKGNEAEQLLFGASHLRFPSLRPAGFLTKTAMGALLFAGMAGVAMGQERSATEQNLNDPATFTQLWQSNQDFLNGRELTSDFVNRINLFLGALTGQNTPAVRDSLRQFIAKILEMVPEGERFFGIVSTQAISALVSLNNLEQADIEVLIRGLSAQTKYNRAYGSSRPDWEYYNWNEMRTASQQALLKIANQTNNKALLLPMLKAPDNEVVSASLNKLNTSMATDTEIQQAVVTAFNEQWRDTNSKFQETDSDIADWLPGFINPFLNIFTKSSIPEVRNALREFINAGITLRPGWYSDKRDNLIAQAIQTLGGLTNLEAADIMVLLPGLKAVRVYGLSTYDRDIIRTASKQALLQIAKTTNNKTLLLPMLKVTDNEVVSATLTKLKASIATDAEVQQAVIAAFTQLWQNNQEFLAGSRLSNDFINRINSFSGALTSQNIAAVRDSLRAFIAKIIEVVPAEKNSYYTISNEAISALVSLNNLEQADIEVLIRGLSAQTKYNRWSYVSQPDWEYYKWNEMRTASKQALLKIADQTNNKTLLLPMLKAPDNEVVSASLNQLNTSMATDTEIQQAVIGDFTQLWQSNQDFLNGRELTSDFVDRIYLFLGALTGQNTPAVRDSLRQFIAKILEMVPEGERSFGIVSTQAISALVSLNNLEQADIELLIKGLSAQTKYNYGYYNRPDWRSYNWTEFIEACQQALFKIIQEKVNVSGQMKQFYSILLERALPDSMSNLSAGRTLPVDVVFKNRLQGLGFESAFAEAAARIINSEESLRALYMVAVATLLEDRDPRAIRAAVSLLEGTSRGWSLTPAQELVLLRGIRGVKIENPKRIIYLISQRITNAAQTNAERILLIDILSGINHPDTVANLIHFLQSEGVRGRENSEVLLSAVEALITLNDPTAIQPIYTTLGLGLTNKKSFDDAVKKAIKESLEKKVAGQYLADIQSLEATQLLLDDFRKKMEKSPDNSQLRSQYVNILKTFIMPLINNPNPIVQRKVTALLKNYSQQAQWDLGEGRVVDVVALLLERLNHPIPSVRLAAVDALRNSRDTRVLNALASLLNDPNIGVRGVAANVLEAQALAFPMEMLLSPDIRIRRIANERLNEYIASLDVSEEEEAAAATVAKLQALSDTLLYSLLVANRQESPYFELLHQEYLRRSEGNREAWLSRVDPQNSLLFDFVISLSKFDKLQGSLSYALADNIVTAIFKGELSRGRPIVSDNAVSLLADILAAFEGEQKTNLENRMLQLANEAQDPLLRTTCGLVILKLIQDNQLSPQTAAGAETFSKGIIQTIFQDRALLGRLIRQGQLLTNALNSILSTADAARKQAFEQSLISAISGAPDIESKTYGGVILLRLIKDEKLSSQNINQAMQACRQAILEVFRSRQNMDLIRSFLAIPGSQRAEIMGLYLQAQSERATAGAAELGAVIKDILTDLRSLDASSRRYPALTQQELTAAFRSANLSPAFINSILSYSRVGPKVFNAALQLLSETRAFTPEGLNQFGENFVSRVDSDTLKGALQRNPALLDNLFVALSGDVDFIQGLWETVISMHDANLKQRLVDNYTRVFLSRPAGDRNAFITSAMFYRDLPSQIQRQVVQKFGDMSRLQKLSLDWTRKKEINVLMYCANDGNGFEMFKSMSNPNWSNTNVRKQLWQVVDGSISEGYLKVKRVKQVGEQKDIYIHVYFDKYPTAKRDYDIFMFRGHYLNFKFLEWLKTQHYFDNGRVYFHGGCRAESQILEHLSQETVGIRFGTPVIAGIGAQNNYILGKLLTQIAKAGESSGARGWKFIFEQVDRITYGKQAKNPYRFPNDLIDYSLKYSGRSSSPVQQSSSPIQQASELRRAYITDTLRRAKFFFAEVVLTALLGGAATVNLQAQQQPEEQVSRSSMQRIEAMAKMAGESSGSSRTIIINGMLRPFLDDSDSRVRDLAISKIIDLDRQNIFSIIESKHWQAAKSNPAIIEKLRPIILGSPETAFRSNNAGAQEIARQILRDYDLSSGESLRSLSNEAIFYIVSFSDYQEVTRAGNNDALRQRLTAIVQKQGLGDWLNRVDPNRQLRTRFIGNTGLICIEAFGSFSGLIADQQGRNQLPEYFVAWALLNKRDGILKEMMEKNQQNQLNQLKQELINLNKRASEKSRGGLRSILTYAQKNNLWMTNQAKAYLEGIFGRLSLEEEKREEGVQQQGTLRETEDYTISITSRQDAETIIKQTASYSYPRDGELKRMAEALAFIAEGAPADDMRARIRNLPENIITRLVSLRIVEPRVFGLLMEDALQRRGTNWFTEDLQRMVPENGVARFVNNAGVKYFDFTQRTLTQNKQLIADMVGFLYRGDVESKFAISLNFFSNVFGSGNSQLKDYLKETLKKEQENNPANRQLIAITLESFGQAQPSSAGGSRIEAIVQSIRQELEKRPNQRDFTKIFGSLKKAGIYNKDLTQTYEEIKDPALKHLDYLESLDDKEFERNMPAWLGKALVATEDRLFWWNPFGVNPVAVFKAWIYNLTYRDTAGSGSSLPQQLVKTIFLSPRKELSRKIIEMRLTLRLDMHLSGEKILTLYGDNIFFGADEGVQIYGVDNAAKYFFGKEAKELNLKECAVLAAIAQRPSYFITHRREAEKRAAYVLKGMVDKGYITEEQAKAAMEFSLPEIFFKGSVNEGATPEETDGNKIDSNGRSRLQKIAANFVRSHPRVVNIFAVGVVVVLPLLSFVGLLWGTYKIIILTQRFTRNTVNFIDQRLSKLAERSEFLRRVGSVFKQTPIFKPLLQPYYSYYWRGNFAQVAYSIGVIVAFMSLFMMIPISEFYPNILKEAVILGIILPLTWPLFFMSERLNDLYIRILSFPINVTLLAARLIKLPFSYYFEKRKKATTNGQPETKQTGQSSSSAVGQSQPVVTSPVAKEDASSPLAEDKNNNPGTTQGSPKFLPSSVLFTGLGLYATVVGWGKIGPVLQKIAAGDLSFNTVGSLAFWTYAILNAGLFTIFNAIEMIGKSQLAHDLVWPLLTLTSNRWTLGIDLKRAIPFRKGDKVLEIGAGAWIPVILSKAVGSTGLYVALDKGKVPTRLNQWLSNRLGRTNALYISADANAIPSGLPQFDKILAIQPIYLHEPDVLKEVSRVLRPDGSFYVVFDMPIPLPGMKAMLEAAGFRLVRTRPVWWFFMIFGMFPIGRMYEFKKDVASSPAATNEDARENAMEQALSAVAGLEETVKERAMDKALEENQAAGLPAQPVDKNSAASPLAQPSADSTAQKEKPVISPTSESIKSVGQPTEQDTKAGSPATKGGIQDASQNSLSINPATEKEPGGIDFRALPIVTQPVGAASPLTLNPPALTLKNVNLEKEWSEIQRMLNAGIIPSSQRIKEYLQSCCTKQEDITQEIDKVLSCIADILRLEEERCQPTEAALKELLVLLESHKPPKDMRVDLINIACLPKDPTVTP